MRSGLWPPILRSTGLFTNGAESHSDQCPHPFDGRWLSPAFHSPGAVTLQDPTFCDIWFQSRLPVFEAVSHPPTQQVKPNSLHFWHQQTPAASFWVGLWDGLPTFISAPPSSFPPFSRILFFYSDACYLSQISRWFLMGGYLIHHIARNGSLSITFLPASVLKY